MCFSSTCRPLESESLLECPYEIAVAELLSCLLDACTRVLKLAVL